jgi:hypothetical protein
MSVTTAVSSLTNFGVVTKRDNFTRLIGLAYGYCRL